MQAFGIKQKWIILIWIVSNGNALRWYTASVVESNNYDTVNSKPNFIQDGEFRYKPTPAETFEHQKRIPANAARDHGKKINTTTPNPASEKVLERNLVTTTVLPIPTTPMNGLYRHIVNETVNIPSKNQNIHPQNSTANQRKITIWRNYVINNTNVIQRRPMKRKIVKRCPTPYRNKYMDGSRKGKFLEVFQVVEFDHVPCTSSSGLEGVCLHEYECLTSGGQTMGVCADGYGSCCVTQFSCGDQTQAHKGWFTNPGYPLPSTERLSCAITVSKASPDITQIRLDFKDFEVTQLTSADEQAAPTGCLQYYRGAHGFLESFNYNDKSSIVLPKIPSYLNNLNYAMCIERAPEACSVTYTNTGNMDIVNFDADDRPLTPPDQAGVEIFNCPSDWLLISAARLCGDRLNDGSVFQDFSLDAPVTDIAAGPIVVWFRSDGARVGRGFRLEYQQNPCTNTARK
ncbi:hypothetical protein JYU34_017457 [Plutella xylostella]|uniref:CUB domain-containing protein n=1 Tax=Plutella xylostella TaxID=51655 RepID=A0ABQ7Q196_PLUXY|nr:hypothetical protein JYU34_017457 [Plutella xylostella]